MDYINKKTALDLVLDSLKNGVDIDTILKNEQNLKDCENSDLRYCYMMGHLQYHTIKFDDSLSEKAEKFVNKTFSTLIEKDGK